MRNQSDECTRNYSLILSNVPATGPAAPKPKAPSAAGTAMGVRNHPATPRISIGTEKVFHSPHERILSVVSILGLHRIEGTLTHASGRGEGEDAGGVGALSGIKILPIPKVVVIGPV